MGEENVRNVLFDIGNSSTSGLYKNSRGQLISFRVFEAKRLVSPLKKLRLDLGEDDCVAYISSVNSLKLEELKKALKPFKKSKIIVLKSTEMKKRTEELGFSVPNIEILGTDLLFDLLGSSPSSVIADYGTASKILLVDKTGVFLGGMIGPGLRVANTSLNLSTDLLKDYKVEVPPCYISYETKDAVNGSATYGEGMKLIEALKRFRHDFKDSKLQLIVTGGDGPLIAKALHKMYYHDFKEEPFLLFKGMAKGLKIYEEFFN
jgi:pantothenate kinase type III